MKRRKTLLLSDTTLRDGEQTPGVRLSPDDKVAIAHALAAAGIHSIDAGFPAAAAEEREAIRRIFKEVRGPVITAHCRTLRQDIDLAAEALEGFPLFSKAVTLFIGLSPQHREHKHRMSQAEVLKTAVGAVDYARRYFNLISFGPEDTARAEPDYLHETYRETIAAGATTIGFADTVGVLTPEKAADRIKAVQDSVPNLANALLAVHFHNDLGLATANALACVAEGVNVVQGTINGIGERAGNTALEEVVMALRLHHDQYGAQCDVDPSHLYELSRLVARLTGFHPTPNKAVVGDNLFITESGVHQDGLLKNLSTYLPFLPEEVGASPARLVLGKHSGRRAVRHCLEQHGLAPTEEQVSQVVEHLKRGPAKPLYDPEQDLDDLVHEVFPAGGPREGLGAMQPVPLREDGR
jgi:2-isopropylmalate synthase